MGNWKYYNNYCYFIQPFNILKTTSTNKRGWANKSGNIFSHSVSTSQPYWIYIYHSQGLNLSIKILATRRYHVCIVCNFPVNPSLSLFLFATACHFPATFNRPHFHMQIWRPEKRFPHVPIIIHGFISFKRWIQLGHYSWWEGMNKICFTSISMPKI